ncbi:hypothetical protein ACFL1R_04010 [Candidatus Latescibacterota bacterium]
MKILVVEPFGEKGHINSNTFFLKALGEIGDVTLATFEGYQKNFVVEKRLCVPDKFRPLDCTKIGAYMGQLKLLRHIRKHLNIRDFDVVFFLCYENISIALSWPRSIPAFLFDHNNVDSIFTSPVKRFIYKHIPKNAIHLAYMDYIVDYIKEHFKRQAWLITHPYYRKTFDNTPAADNLSIPERAKGRKVIFSPSGSNNPEIVEKLKSFVLRSKRFYLVAKSKLKEKGDDFEFRPFFDDYEEHMLGCDYVFFGGRYDYRVSGIVFEALSFRKPAVVLDCVFAQELKKIYPHSIIPMRDVSEIEFIELNQKEIYREHKRFLTEHSYDRIKSELVQAFHSSLA